MSAEASGTGVTSGNEKSRRAWLKYAYLQVNYAHLQVCIWTSLPLIYHSSSGTAAPWRVLKLDAFVN
eukprot:894113-Pelagomonas_calceolata.AAC.4